MPTFGDPDILGDDGKPKKAAGKTKKKTAKKDVDIFNGPSIFDDPLGAT